MSFSAFSAWTKYSFMCFSVYSNVIARITKVQRSRNKLRNRKSANLLDQQTFRKCDYLRICDLQTQTNFVICGLRASSQFAELKLPQIIFLLTNIGLKSLVCGERQLVYIFAIKSVMVCSFIHGIKRKKS
jgi:hypothetical protein